MNRSGLPWVILVLALLGWQVGGSSGAGTATKPAAAPASNSDAPGAPSTPGPGERASWPQLDALVADYFGAATDEASSDTVEPSSDDQKAKAAKAGKAGAAEQKSTKTTASKKKPPLDLLKLAKDAGYRPPDVYIALVADPIDSFLPARFDQALAGIQEGFAEAGFLLDRIDLPWAAQPEEGKSTASPADPAYRKRPGILLFRRPGRAGAGRIAIVFLVGETAKGGVHKAAFRLALETAHGLASPRRLASGRSVERIRILGPTFSGSRESLRLTFASWKPKLDKGRQPPEVWLISGSATSSWLNLCAFDCGKGIRFFRSVMDDGSLLEEGKKFLSEKLGWRIERMALLSEADTAYGQNAHQLAEASDESDDLLVLKFPSGLSGLRKASEDAARGAAPTKAAPRLGPTPLAISLADSSRPIDVVPEFSILTTPTKDLALSNFLAVLCGEGKKSYLGIVATDTRDQIFLAERAQEICPDLQLFLLDSDLLLAHPQNRDALDGAILLSSSALFTRGLPWLEDPVSDGSRPPWIGMRQFQSELHEGVVHAVRALLADAELPAEQKPAHLETPRVWISAIGNGSIWPLAQLRPGAAPGRKAAARAPSDPNRPKPVMAGAKANALTLTCLLVIVALSVWLVRVARPLREIPNLPPDLRDRFPFLLALSAILVAWGVLEVVGALPWWAFGETWSRLETMTDDALWLGVFFTAVGLGAFFLRDWLPARWTGLPKLGVSLRWIAIVSLVASAGGLLACPLLHAWMPGGIELFYFRARKFTGGMSPLVSLAWVGGGIFLWAILEMKRRALVAFQGSKFPIPELPGEDPVLPGCREIARSLEQRMLHTFPTWRFWAVFGAPLVLAAIYLYQFIQPVAESRAYGRVFAGLAIGSFTLALVSFHRFLRLWAELSGLLDRIETLSLDAVFRALHEEVDWRPMKSFAWLIPPFKMSELSIAKLAAVGGPASSEPMRSCLALALEGHRLRDPKKEADGRSDLQQKFEAALSRADAWRSPGPLQDFVVVRLIAYVRTVFAHLRNSLMSALVPGFFLLLAITSYEVQPKRVLFLSIWSALAAAVLMTIWVFVHMDRNATLSAIGGTEAGKTDVLDRSFVQSILTYGVLPLLGLVATRFPQIERLLQGYLNPLMKMVGGGGG